MPETTAYDFEAATIDGGRLDFASLRGQVLLVVNTASACGFTPQFAGLEALWQRYRARGLVVVGFPCNQFGAQDPGSDVEIGAFCRKNYGVSFPMMARVEVNGARAHPLWQWLTAEAPGLLGTRAVKTILSARRHRRLRLDDIGRLTRSIAKVRPFIIAADWRPDDRADLRTMLAPPSEQLELFAA